ncbi:MAG: nuclear transport factor 2 family protein [Pseudomonadota bacterium]
MDLKDAEVLVTRYADAMRAQDIDTIMSLYAAHATVEDPVGTPAREGADAIRAFYSLAMQSSIDMQRTGAVRFTGGALAFPFRATIGGGERIIEGIDVFELDETHKIVSMKAFFGPENVIVDEHGKRPPGYARRGE